MNHYFFALQAQEYERSKRRTKGKRFSRWIIGAILTACMIITAIVLS